MMVKIVNRQIVLPAEWEPQSGIQLTWPHGQSDWAACLDEAVACFVRIAKEVALRQKLLVVTQDIAQTTAILDGCQMDNITLVCARSNDTWCRDHGGVTVFDRGHPVVLDFKFNGWGLKFAADADNQITKELFVRGVFASHVTRRNLLNFVLEGGSIESDGKGTIMTTSECLLCSNRNGQFSKFEIEEFLKVNLGANRVLWVDNGYLAGDDTDSHIDTLVRFCDAHTIAYVSCDDKADVHYDALKKMESQLRQFVAWDGQPYRLVPLPMADAVIWEQQRLPATYANFLIINDAVLVPTYGSPKDEIAKAQLAKVFTGRHIVGVDCQVLITQHGSLHCVTMQYPQGVVK